MSRTAAFTKTLHEVGAGTYAYVQHDGSWGWSNSGLVTDGRHALVVDTLFDLHLTRELLDAYQRVLPAGAAIDALVNSHANGDHTFGNQLLPGVRIMASRRTAEEMAETPPSLLAGLMRAAPQLGVTGEFLQRIFGTFDFEDIQLVTPAVTFDGELAVQVGERTVRLIEVGPAHTRGDTIVLVPDARTVFTADILFVGGHPIIWEGPLDNWLRALDKVLELEVDTVVPGHGPVCDKSAVADLKAYFEYLDREARQRFDAGLNVMQSALDISFADYGTWGEAERIVANVGTLFRWYSGSDRPPTPEVLSAMAEFDLRRRAAAP